jgi:branched-chain amino acid aminotransferase
VKESLMVLPESIIDVANKEGIEVDVRPVLVSELVEASKDGTLKYLVQVLQPWLIIIGFSSDVYYELPKIENSMRYN